MLLSEPELVHQSAIGGGLLQRVQVRPLDVLHQRPFEHGLGGGLPHDGGHLFEAGQPGCPPAALSRDEGIGDVGPQGGAGDDQRLYHPVFANGGGQLRQRVGIEGMPRLMGIRPDRLNRDLNNARLFHFRWRGDARADQRAQATPQTTL